jgi:hypothetical protein
MTQKAWWLAITPFLLALVAGPGRAADEKAPSPRIAAEVEVNCPILTKLPYVGKLFKQVESPCAPEREDVLIQVHEAPTDMPLFGVGFNSDAGATGGIVIINERNFDLHPVPACIGELVAGHAFRLCCPLSPFAQLIKIAHAKGKAKKAECPFAAKKAEPAGCGTGCGKKGQKVSKGCGKDCTCNCDGCCKKGTKAAAKGCGEGCKCDCKDCCKKAKKVVKKGRAGCSCVTFFEGVGQIGECNCCGCGKKGKKAVKGCGCKKKAAKKGCCEGCGCAEAVFGRSSPSCSRRLCQSRRRPRAPSPRRRRCPRPAPLPPTPALPAMRCRRARRCRRTSPGCMSSR